MNANRSVLILGLSILLITSGCTTGGGRLIISKSSGVDQIPVDIGFYPLLSTPMDSYRGGREHYAEIASRSVDVKKMPDNVVIAPPVEAKLSITQESQILMGLISTHLSGLGFSLKELPVEIAPEDKYSITGDNDRKTFVISINLLNELREKYDIKALIIGNAFFINERRAGMAPEKRVISAHVKIVDIGTLDLLAQVSLPYEMYGVDMNTAARKISLALAEMADLTNE